MPTIGAMEAERKSIEEFLNYIADHVGKSGGVVARLQERHHYPAAEAAAMIGYAANAALNPRNHTLTMGEIVSKIQRDHGRWARSDLAAHKRQWEFQKKEQYAREKSGGGNCQHL